MLLFLFPAAPLYADQDKSKAATIRAEPVVVSVSAQEIPLSATSASVTVLTRDYIEKSHARNVTELLRQIPFLHISQTGGVSGLATVTLRGGDPNFTMVMIDGVAVNDPTNLLGGSFDFSTLSTDNIEQIEIVRGPLSSIYGSEAVSGVIHIVSRRSGSTAFSGEASAGNLESRHVSAGTQYQNSRFHYSLNGSYQELRHDQEQSSSLGTVSFAGDLVLGKRLVGLTMRYQENSSEGFPENGGGPEFSVLRELKQIDATGLVAAVRYVDQLNEGWLYNLDVNLFDHEEDSSSPAILDGLPPTKRSLPSFENRTGFQRTRFQFLTNWKRGNLSGSLGAALKWEQGSSNGLIAESFPSSFSLNRFTSGFTGEALYSTDHWNVTAGLRIDNPEEFSVEFSPRFGLSYRFATSGTRLKTTWGEGYKLPSFFALGDPNIGNPLLRPERSRGWDAGVEQELIHGRLVTSATVFRNSFEDLIDFSPEEFVLVNRRLAILQGVEWETRVVLSEDLEISGHLGYLDADIKNTTEPLRDRPAWRGGVTADWQITRDSHLQLSAVGVGSRFDFQLPVPERNVAESYGLLNLSFEQRLPFELLAYLRIENLLDNHYQEFAGFPNPGRYARFGIEYHLGNKK